MPLYFSGYQTRTARFQEELDASTEDVLGATAEQTFSEMPINSYLRLMDLGEAKRGAKMDNEAARKKVSDAGLDGQLSVPSYGLSEAALDIMIERKQNELRRQDILSRAPQGVGATAAQFGTSIAVSMLDPINVGLAFVPYVGQARYLRYLASARGIVGRTAVRVGVGGFEGAVGAAIVEPIVAIAKTQEQADYDFQDSLLNVAFGTAFGGGLHAVAGAGADAARAIGKRFSVGDINASAASATPAGSIGKRIADEPLPTQEAALRTAVGQAMEGKTVDVEPILRIPAEERLIRSQVDEALATREAQLRAITEGEEATAVRVGGDAQQMLAELQQSIELRDQIAHEIAQTTDPTRRAELIEQQATAQRVLDSRQGAVDRLNRVRASEAELEQLQYARGAARSIDELVDALPSAQQSGFRRRIEQGRASGDVRAQGSAIGPPAEKGVQPDSSVKRPAAVMEERASPAVDLTADVRASEVADAQLKEVPAAADEVAIQEAQLADEEAQLKEAAKLAGIDLTDELAAVDEDLQLFDTYAKAARAAVVCGINH